MARGFPDISRGLHVFARQQKEIDHETTTPGKHALLSESGEYN